MFFGEKQNDKAVSQIKYCLVLSKNDKLTLLYLTLEIYVRSEIIGYSWRNSTFYTYAYLPSTTSKFDRRSMRFCLLPIQHRLKKTIQPNPNESFSIFQVILPEVLHARVKRVKRVIRVKSPLHQMRVKCTMSCPSKTVKRVKRVK